MRAGFGVVVGVLAACGSPPQAPLFDLGGSNDAARYDAAPIDAAGFDAAPSDAANVDAALPPRMVTNSYWIDPGAGPAPIAGGTFSSSTTLSSPMTLDGISETEVFARELVHAEDAAHGWRFHVGTGGQIYSIVTAAGELIGAQGSGAEWMDRVLQSIAVDQAVVTGGGLYFIQQAGAYPTTAGQVPFYSPLLGDAVDATAGTFRTMTWPQQSHLDVDQSVALNQSTFLLQQTVRDLGHGGVEITWIYSNWGGARCDFLDLPWMGLSHAKVPFIAASTPDAGWTWGADVGWTNNIVNIAQTYGWVGFVDQQSATGVGMSFVYAKPNVVLTGCGAGCGVGMTCTAGGCAPDASAAACSGQPDGTGCTAFEAGAVCVAGACRTGLGAVRWGNNLPEDLDVLEALPSVSHGGKAVVAPGKTYYYRLFLVFDELSAGMHPRSNALAPYVTQGELDFTLGDAGLIDACTQLRGATFADCHFYTFDRPLDGARPLFLLRDENDAHVFVSTSPYALSYVPSDRRTTYLSFLGWTLPATTLTPPDPRWAKLSALVPAAALDGAQPDVWVVTTP